MSKKEPVPQNTSACRSGSKVGNRIIRRTSKIKVKKTGSVSQFTVYSSSTQSYLKGEN
jgi:hypothetical protein